MRGANGARPEEQPAARAGAARLVGAGGGVGRGLRRANRSAVLSGGAAVARTFAAGVVRFERPGGQGGVPGSTVASPVFGRGARSADVRPQHALTGPRAAGQALSGRAHSRPGERSGRRQGPGPQAGHADRRDPDRRGRRRAQEHAQGGPTRWRSPAPTWWPRRSEAGARRDRPADLRLPAGRLRKAAELPSHMTARS